MQQFNRSLSTSAKLLARTKFTIPKPPPPKRSNVRLPTQTTHHSNDLKITAPIPPTVANLQCPDDHPLWQFFSNKKFLRSEEELDFTARAWSVPELRRKSFNDLHSLWYICLKERNILARETHLLEVSIGADAGPYMELAETIRTTMWRIRHVLSERDHAYNLAKSDFKMQKEKFNKIFATDFVNNETYPIDNTETWEVLKRFQFAVFGISEIIEDNVIDRDFVDGLKFIANLKLQKLNQDAAKAIGNITDAGEAFVLFTAENNSEAFKEAIDIVNELKTNNKTISRYDELETISSYVDQMVIANSTQAPEISTEQPTSST